MKQLRVFIGYDTRQPLAYNVLQHSIISRSSVSVSITPLVLSQLPMQRRGLTEFTYSRFLVPHLCNYVGTALFLDADMVVTGDIAELFSQADVGAYDVQVMQNQKRFEWPSAMLFNCMRCLKLTPEYIEDTANQLLDLKWAKAVGTFSDEWNHCVGYASPGAAKLYHYTQGIPCWPETKGVEGGPWMAAFKRMIHTVSWKELMGGSVHAEPVKERLHG